MKNTLFYILITLLSANLYGQFEPAHFEYKPNNYDNNNNYNKRLTKLQSEYDQADEKVRGANYYFNSLDVDRARSNEILSQFSSEKQCFRRI
jgi:hypothetical protein